MSSENEILKSCQKGNFEDFAKIYDMYFKKIYVFIYHKTLHKESAEDITSEVFIKTLESINSYSFEKGTFSSWIFKIARNSVIDFFRTKKNHLNIDDIWDISSLEDIEYESEILLNYEKLQTHLKKIKTEHREILMMKLWQNLSYKEISEITGKSQDNSKKIVSRTIQKLKKEINLFLFFFLLINI